MLILINQLLILDLLNIWNFLKLIINIDKLVNI